MPWASRTGGETQMVCFLNSSQTHHLWERSHAVHKDRSSKHDDITVVIPAIQSAVKVLKERNDTDPSPDPTPDPTNLLPSGLYFSSSSAAASANLITYWDPPANDPSILSTQAGAEAWIHRIWLKAPFPNATPETAGDSTSSRCMSVLGALANIDLSTYSMLGVWEHGGQYR